MRNAFDLFGSAWSLVTGHPKIFVTISFFTTAVITGSMVLFGVDPASQSQDLPTTPEFGFMLVSIVVGMLANIAMIRAVSSPAETDIGNVLGFSVGKFFSYLLVVVFVGATVLVGLVFLVLPGIFFAVALSFATYVLILEDVRGVDALKRSYGYVKGRWFAVFGRYLFLLVIGLLLTVVLSFLTAGTPESSYLASFGIGFLSMLASAVSIAYTYGMYTDLKSTPAVPVVEAPHENTEN